MIAELEDFIQYMREVKEKSENTIISYKRDLDKLIEFLCNKENKTLGEVTERDLDGFVSFLKSQNLKNTTIARNIASTKSFFHFLFRTGRITKDVSANIRSPKIEKKLPETLTIEETEKLLSQPDENSVKGLRDKTMMELLYATGIRVTELVNLKLDDVDLRTDSLSVRENGKERFVPFGRDARAVLDKYLKSARNELLGEKESVYLFTNLNGEAMTRQGFWKILKYYGKKAKIEKEIAPHTIRHSFAVHLIENGADVRSVQKMLGHTNLSATLPYTRISQNPLRMQYIKAHPGEQKKRGKAKNDNDRSD